ncbi:MAG: poly(A) polymerase [Pseudomonadota bacterium]|nr:poly(A) polymerase [Pseudomonadota bacterium]
MPIIKFFKKLLKTSSPTSSSTPVEFTIPRNQHHVSKSEININALQVINKLNHHGYETYLVGGSVRDLLLRKVPKDFDVSTSATPQQIKKLFRNARIIGRRFKLVHITFGREIIEVSTFRSNQPDEQVQTNEKGMVIRDNVYGNLEQDSWRRDFTINSLYYNINDGSIVDYTGGFKDVKAKRIHMIGQADTRYQEDPVRMLRAIRFAAKLHFVIAEDTAEPMFRLGHLIQHVSNARLFDEVAKLWQCYESKRVFELLQHYELFKYLFPLTVTSLKVNPHAQEFIENAFENTDARMREQKPTTPAFLFAVLLWYPMRDYAQELIEKEQLHPLVAIEQAMNKVLNEQSRIISIPRRFTQIIREIWLLQYRFSKRIGQKPFILMSHARFRAAYDFLLLRAIAQDEKIELAQWWTQFQESSETEQLEMIEALETDKRPKTRRKRSKKAPKND